jgi:hypothetical protein
MNQGKANAVGNQTRKPRLGKWIKESPTPQAIRQESAAQANRSEKGQRRRRTDSQTSAAQATNSKKIPTPQATSPTRHAEQA